MADPKISKPQEAVNIRSLNFYLTPAHACSYLPHRQASSLIADLRVRIDTQTYGTLINYGFRRSGDYVYRPHCQGCDACIPVRVPVTLFRPRRAQKRIWRRNQDLDVRRVAVAYQEEHFTLYQRYISDRHNGGGMDHTSPEHYMDFIKSSDIDTALYEFRLSGQLLAVAVVDHLQDALSAVYTFFDPDHEARSLGAYAILWEIHEARRLGLNWLYLGYWIKQCPKMSYKSDYRPLEIYRNGRWILLDE